MLATKDKIFIGIVGTGLAILIVVFIRFCNNPEEPLYVPDRERPHIDTIYNNDSMKVYQQALRVISDAHARQLKQYADSIFNLNKRYNGKIARLTEIVQRIRVDSVKIHFDSAAQNAAFDSLHGDMELIRERTIPVPAPFAYADSTFEISGIVQKDGVKINSVELPNTLYQREIEQRYGFLKLKRRTVVQSFNTNPHVEVVGGVTTKIEHKTSAWNRWIKPVLFTAAGAFIGAKATQ
jgi:hypothetical protein